MPRDGTADPTRAGHPTGAEPRLATIVDVEGAIARGDEVTVDPHFPHSVVINGNRAVRVTPQARQTLRQVIRQGRRERRREWAEKRRERE